MAGAAWRWVGDRALLRALPGDDVAAANRAALALYRSLRDRRFDEVADLVPGARSLLVILAEGAEPTEALVDALEAEPGDDAGLPGPTHEIPVHYGGGDGPDLADVARWSGLTEDEVVRLHAAPTYTVAFVGFSPGFPYLLGLDPALVTPRLDTPRVRVAQGSVAIGDTWTGIYPRATPGGWRLIGRADVELFDPTSDPPTLLGPGDHMRFVPR